MLVTELYAFNLICENLLAALYGVALNRKMSYVLFLIMFLGAALGIMVNVIQQRINKRALNNPTNSFLPIIENKSKDKILKYAYENELSESEKKLKYVLIENNNIKVLLPCPNVYMMLKTKININELKTNYTYKMLVSKSEVFVVLSDLRINEDKLILYFKLFEKKALFEKENDYSLLTLNDEMIGNVRLMDYLE